MALPPLSVGSYESGQQMHFTAGLNRTPHTHKKGGFRSPCPNFLSLHNLSENNFLIDSQASWLFLSRYFFQEGNC